MTVVAAPPFTWAHREAVVNGVRLHYVEAGAGPLVILLHGFPEFWYCWRRQIPALAAAGFHVVAPDQRGYNRSDKPVGVSSYRIESLTADIAALIVHLGEHRAHVVGHDWGGVVAWSLAGRHPEVVERLAVLNAPHPAAFRRELLGPAQLLKSWYIFFFQLPWLPEQLLRADDFAILTRAFHREPTNSEAFTDHDIRLYKEALAQPGALTAALNWYRAMFRMTPHQLAESERPLAVETLLIWGERDRYLGRSLTEGLGRWVPHLRVERLPNVSHWVQNDAPDQVNQLLIDFLQEQ